jgi:hypothetical protein
MSVASLLAAGGDQGGGELAGQKLVPPLRSAAGSRPRLFALCTLTGEEFSGEFEPAATRPRLAGLGLAGLTSVMTLFCGW